MSLEVERRVMERRAHGRPDLHIAGSRKADRRTEAEELRMEVRAAGQEMQAFAIRIRYALQAGDLYTVNRFAARLEAIGSGYADDTGGSAA